MLLSPVLLSTAYFRILSNTTTCLSSILLFLYSRNELVAITSRFQLLHCFLVTVCIFSHYGKYIGRGPSSLIQMYVCSLQYLQLIPVFICYSCKEQKPASSGCCCIEISAAKPNDSIIQFYACICGWFSVLHLNYKQSEVGLFSLSCTSSPTT